MKKLTIIVPCYNEEEVFAETNTVLNGVLDDLKNKKKIALSSNILYVDDGSKDSTWELISKEFEANEYVVGIKFAGNKGHQNAVYAGLMEVRKKSDFTITIDADLQDDVNVIEEMVDKYNDGAHVVYGVRNDRTTDSFFKRTSANMFYSVIKGNGSKAINNAADFRLLSKEVVEELSLYNEFHLYLRGMIPELGFKQECVYYKRKERTKGVSKYSLKKMIKLAMDGITSCNDTPLFSFFYIGGILLLFSVFFLIFTINGVIKKSLYTFFPVMFIILLIGGLLVLGLAFLGQYIGRTYMESKRRPRYYVETVLEHKKRGKEE